MNNLDERNISKPLDRESKAAWAQIGWLGRSGKTYGLDTPLDEIHANEPAAYRPLYIIVGEWVYDEELKDWFLEGDD